MIIQGNCLEKLKELADESVDAVVCDPPYHLVSIVKRFGKEGSAPAKEGKDGSFKRLSGGFMGKTWDGVDENGNGIAYNVDLWKECLRVLKPGGHLLSFGGTRTYHRMAVAIEDAGFEVRDMLEWIYASGFPKSLNVGKAVDKLQGNEREHIATIKKLHFSGDDLDTNEGWSRPSHRNPDGTAKRTMDITKGNSEWEGFGTALKPAHEPIIMARRPLECKTIVENCLKHGTGAIDIDGCRIPTREEVGRDNTGIKNSPLAPKDGWNENSMKGLDTRGQQTARFPANIICTDDALNDGVMTKSATSRTKRADRKFAPGTGYQGGFAELEKDEVFNETSGSKSRYFDIDVWAEKHGLLQFPKASKRERNEGLDELEAKQMYKQDGSGQSLEIFGSTDGGREARKNFHPTVKPVHLMSWLVRLVSKEGDTVLDPFMGSGTTGVACKQLNRNFIGIELSEEYVKIAEARINAIKQENKLL